MKKTIALVLAMIMCISLCACDSNRGAFNASKEAFDNVTLAYIATNEFSSDIYEAWYLGVNSRSSYDDSYEFSDFCDEMSIEKEYIEQGVASLLDKDSFSTSDWETLPYLYNNSYFSAWISVISEAYKCSGDAEEIEKKLIVAKSLMKQLSDDYSDYEHYPSLKKYFTNTVAFFNFCCDPEGSFEQVVETFNSYRNNAREYFFDLNYVFSDSIGGFEDYLNVGEDTEDDADANTEKKDDKPVEA